MLVQNFAGGTQPHCDIFRTRIRNSRPAVWPVDRKNGHEHGNHQRDRYPPGGQSQQQQLRAEALKQQMLVAQQEAAKKEELEKLLTRLG